MTKIYNRLEEVRSERGMTRDAMAHVLGLSYQELGYLERGDILPDLVLALRISAFFSIPVEAIFSLEPFKPAQSERGFA